MVTTEIAASVIYSTLTKAELDAVIAGSYTEAKATEWLARAGVDAVTPGTYDGFDNLTTEQQEILDRVHSIALAVRLA